MAQLPPYSPELNPIENLWRYLKSHYWSNRNYADYDALEDAAMTVWRSAVLRYCQMLCSEKFFKRRIPAGFRLGRNGLRRRV
jgi:transposase